MENILSDPDVASFFVNDTQAWQAAHRHVLEHLWAAWAQQESANSGEAIGAIIDVQIEAMKGTYGKSASKASKDHVCEVQAKIHVIGMDVKNIVFRDGKHGVGE